MTSEIKVDTISEQTSANGVTIDGLTIKDGNIQGSPALVGTTPSFTIGDGGAEDTKIVFDGNALDYYIGLDDSADNLIIGSGSTVGSNSLITIDSDGDLSLDIAGDILLDAGGADIRMISGGTDYCKFTKDGNNTAIKSQVSDGDLILRGSDSGVQIDALTFDMSAAGHATFNNQITSGSHIIIPATSRLYLDGSGDTFISEVAANAIAFTTGNSERVRINSSGNMGVATNSPVSKLTVAGQVTATGGAVSAPTYSFDNDTNTGMTRPTTDTLTLVTAGAEAVRVTSGQTISTGGESSPDVGAGGLGLDQNANDDAIITFKSSDVAHGMTDLAETDTYAKISKVGAAIGGIDINGYMETGATQAVRLGALSTDDNTTKSVDGGGKVLIQTYKKSGTTVTAPGSNANLLAITSSSNTRFIFDQEGDFHADSSSTTFDAYEDAQLVRAFDLSHGKGVINSQFDKYVKYKHEDLAEAGLVGREVDGTPNHFINVTGFQRLHNGAIWQQYEKHQQLPEAVYEMAKEALGKDKADAILNKHNIKLLN